MSIVTISELYNYPITVNSEDFEKYLGVRLSDEIRGDTNVRISTFLDTVHRCVYDFLIYNTGDKEIKDGLLRAYPEQLTNPIKRALLVQGQYLLSNQNIELFNGVIKTVSGAEFKETADVITKIIAPSLINILGATRPNILYAGG